MLLHLYLSRLCFLFADQFSLIRSVDLSWFGPKSVIYTLTYFALLCSLFFGIIKLKCFPFFEHLLSFTNNHTLKTIQKSWDPLLSGPGVINHSECLPAWTRHEPELQPVEKTSGGQRPVRWTHQSYTKSKGRGHHEQQKRSWFKPIEKVKLLWLSRRHAL